MTSHLIKLLIAFCIGLIILIIAEFSYAHQAQLKLKQELTDTPVEKRIEAVLPSINLKEKLVNHYTDFIARPLFSQTRKPIEPFAATTPAIVKKTKIKTTPFKHQLIGIYGRGTQKKALFRNKGKNKKDKPSISLQVGEKIDHWVIKAIKTNHIDIESQGKIETVSWSTFKPKRIKRAKKRLNRKKKGKKKGKKPPLNPFLKKNKRSVPPPAPIIQREP